MWGRSANQHGDRQRLLDHLTGVAARAQAFGANFDAADFCYWLGLWHDVGKADPRWQDYLAKSSEGAWGGPRPDHKCAGASLALAAGSELGPLVIHGHHGGLGDLSADFKSWYERHKNLPATHAALAWAGANLPSPPVEMRLHPGWVESRLDAELLVRLAFSALVDADTLDAEAHQLAGTTLPRGSVATIEDLWRRFAAFSAAAPRGGGPVQGVRDQVLRDCLAAAESPRGLFRLTVPTGGGKTRSALAFALRHAANHGLRRVIVAVPFTTITEQTAQVYRDIFGELASGAVLEHHSAAHERQGADEADGCSADGEWSRLAAENWEAPIVVTTTVQLFESLFAHKRNAMRKVHNLAKSVIILDEAQALPAPLLDPILDALQGLARNCGSSVVLSTATQPAFEAVKGFAGLEAHEIVRGHAEHFGALRRVDWEWKTNQPHQWSEVSDWIRATPTSLTIVNTKRHATELLAELDDPEALHLSTLLCGAHRRDVLAEVKRRLAGGQPCRLVSTQVVEAGVDLDFPVVFRSLAPVDSMIQAAGRCNREGRLPGRGRIVIFEPPDPAIPPGAYQTAAGLARIFDGSPDLTDPATVKRASALYFASVDTDSRGIQACRSDFKFPEVANRFRMIDDNRYDVVVLWGTSAERARVQAAVHRLRAKDPAVRDLMRTLQPFVVALYQHEAERLKGTLIDEIMPGLGWWNGRYGVHGLEVRDPELVV